APAHGYGLDFYAEHPGLAEAWSPPDKVSCPFMPLVFGRELLFDDHDLVRQRKWHPQAAARVPRDVADGRILSGHRIDGELQRSGIDADQLIRLFCAFL